jgi:hypothetical protein
MARICPILLSRVTRRERRGRGRQAKGKGQGKGKGKDGRGYENEWKKKHASSTFFSPFAVLGALAHPFALSGERFLFKIPNPKRMLQPKLYIIPYIAGADTFPRHAVGTYWGQ